MTGCTGPRRCVPGRPGPVRWRRPRRRSGRPPTRSCCHQAIPPAPIRALARAGVGPWPDGMASTSSNHRRPSARWPRCCQNRHSAPAAAWAAFGVARVDRPPRARRGCSACSRSQRSSHARWSVGGQVRLGLDRQVEEVRGVAARGPPRVIRRLELFQRELPDRLQHREPEVAVRVRPPDQRHVDERRQPVEGVQADLLRAGRPPRPAQRPSAGEHREPGEQPPLRRVEQVVAPGDRASEGPLALGERSARRR